MKKFEIILALEQVAAARKKWNQAERKFRSDLGSVMRRLILEAAHNRMSAEDVGRNSGYSAREIRRMMRDSGLDPKKGKTLLAKQSADALAENAALLGVDPHEMDLTSPLAYLPMGSELRRFLETSRVTGEDVDTEISEADAVLDVAFLLWQVEQGYIKDEDRAVSSDNWFKLDVSSLHPDDAEGRKAWIEAAREVLRVVKRIKGLDFKVAIETNLDQPTTCRVYRNGVLVFAGQDRTAMTHRDLPLHRTEVSIDRSCSTCDGGGCPDCTDPA